MTPSSGVLAYHSLWRVKLKIIQTVLGISSKHVDMMLSVSSFLGRWAGTEQHGVNPGRRILRIRPVATQALNENNVANVSHCNPIANAEHTFAKREWPSGELNSNNVNQFSPEFALASRETFPTKLPWLVKAHQGTPFVRVSEIANILGLSHVVVIKEPILEINQSI